MQHLQLLGFIVAVATGFAGITTTAILRTRLREPILTVMLAVMSTFTAGLVLFVVEFYLSQIVGLAIEAQRLITAVNLLLVFVMYGGIGTIVVRSDSDARLWPLVVLALLVLATYVLFGLLQPVALLQAIGSTGVAIISTAVASLFLGYSGVRLLVGARRTRVASIRFLLRSLGVMLTSFAALSIVLSILVRGSDPPVTTILNFVLYVALNATAIANFVRYLSAPADVFNEKGVPESALRRYGISSREAEVISLISRGLSNREIAEKLGIGFTTARTHVYNVFKKTGAASRVELLRILSAG